MLIDSRNEFCNAVALNTGVAGTYLIGSQIDLGATADGLYGLDDLYLVISVETTATSGGSATGQFILASDASAAIATDGTATAHYTSAAFAVAAMTAGTKLVVAEVPNLPTAERYLGILQVTGTAAFTAGKVDAYLTRTPPVWKAFPDAL